MVKVEPASSEDHSDSDSDSPPATPLAASTQKTPPKKVKPDLSRESDDGSSSEDSPQPSQTSFTSKSPSRITKNATEKYLNKFPFVRPGKPRNSVDFDLSDSNDEVWIVKCPASIDARKVLLGAKFGSFSFGSVSTISSPQADQQLEGVLVKNDSEKPVTLMDGTEFKSFVPVGTIQIRETLEMDELPIRPIKSELTQSKIVIDEEIPFPAEIRDRHPLLGVDYEPAQQLPKRVKKALSLAQQRSEAFYLRKEVAPMEATAAEQEMTSPKGKRSKKRKREDNMLDFVDSAAADDAIKMMIKEEAQSPSPRKKKLKKEVEAAAAEDDLSWLNDM